LLAAGTTIKINDHTFALYDSSRGQVAPSGTGTTAIDIASFKSNEEIIDALVANSGNVTDVTLSKTAQNVLTITADTEGTDGKRLRIADQCGCGVNKPQGCSKSS
jgi:hypothetical protein